MNLDTARHLRAMLSNSDWLTRTRAFATGLRTAGHSPGGLLLVGTPEHEPWHFAAHLDDAARLSGQPHLAPTLVRHHVPTGAAPHLAVDLSRLRQAARGQTVLVVAPTPPSDDLLNRIDDAHRAGAVILSIDAGDLDLQTIAHDTLTIPELALSTTAAATPAGIGVTVDTLEHLVSLSTGEPAAASDHRRRGTQRLSRILDHSGRR